MRNKMLAQMTAALLALSALAPGAQAKYAIYFGGAGGGEAIELPNVALPDDRSGYDVL